MVYLSKIRTHSYKLQFNNNRLVGSFALCLVSMGGKVVSTSSSDSWLINRDNSSVRVSNQVSVQVERSSITVANSSNGGSSNSGNSSNSRSSSNNRGSSSISSSLGSKMVGTGSSNSWLIKRNNSSVRVSNELSVQVKRTSISVGSSIGRGISCISSGNGSSSNKRSSSSIPSISQTSIPSISVPSSISWCISSISQTCSKLGSKMVSTGSSNCWLINRGHSSVRVGLKTKETLGRGYGHTGSKNQKLHIYSQM